MSGAPTFRGARVRSWWLLQAGGCCGLRPRGASIPHTGPLVALWRSSPWPPTCKPNGGYRSLANFCSTWVRITWEKHLETAERSRLFSPQMIDYALGAYFELGPYGGCCEIRSRRVSTFGSSSCSMSCISLYVSALVRCHVSAFMYQLLFDVMY
jgi:hypothetical protein